MACSYAAARLNALAPTVTATMASTPMRLKGDVSRVMLDGRRVKGTGFLVLETAAAATSSARYDVEIAGGASRVVLDES
jgi:hypothetical protein